MDLRLRPADESRLGSLRAAILNSEFRVALHRARTYTSAFEEAEADGTAWVVAKARAFRAHLRTMPLWLRPGDQLAGSLTEFPGAMPLIVELGIGENGIFTDEDPHRAGYLRGAVPQEIRDFWQGRNMRGRWRGYMTQVLDRGAPDAERLPYKFLSCQGHLSPSYRALLRSGLGGLRERIARRRMAETDPSAKEWLLAADLCVQGVCEWIGRYARLDEVARDPETARIAARVVSEPPETFREALALLWFCHQAIHIEGHGYSCTPDRLDQILYPFYRADLAAGRLTNEDALALCCNFVLKMRDNTFWSVEHNLTQGISLGGSSPRGDDQTNELSWIWLRAAELMALPEPLVWVRWHERIDRDFLDRCLTTLSGRTCFPLFMSDTTVPSMFMGLGVDRDDAHDYVAVGCNELALPGKAYFNPCAWVNYLDALWRAMAQPESEQGFGRLLGAIEGVIRQQVERSYADGMVELEFQRRYAQSPFTSCFFDGCVEDGHDLVDGTRYNLLSCGGTAFANLVDCLSALRSVVYGPQPVTLAQVLVACADNFVGHELLRARLQAAPKHGNDDPRVLDIIHLVERMRDEAVEAVCFDPRDGARFGNSHVVRSSAVLAGRHTGATPDGRLAGEPLAGSVAAAHGEERSGPTALLASVLALSPRSWRSGYNVNLRLSRDMLTDRRARGRVRALLDAYFAAGGQELQINCVDNATLLAARECPHEYRDLVVRVAGFSEFFVKLDPALQDEVISRAEHRL